jgi:hypothetical protein
MTTYRVNDDHYATAAYALSVLSAIATGEGPASCDETAAEYAQRHINAMVAEGSVHVEDES